MQTPSTAKSSKLVVMFVGVGRICPPGCAVARKPEEVQEGQFFVQFKPVVDVGAWTSEIRERPWCVAVKRDDRVFERGFYSSLDEAVKRARRLNERMHA